MSLRRLTEKTNIKALTSESTELKGKEYCEFIGKIENGT